MNRHRLREALRRWDMGEFDFSEKLSDAARPPRSETAVSKSDWDAERTILRLERLEERSYSRYYPILAVLLSAVMIVFLLLTVEALPKFGDPAAPTNNEVSEHYLELGLTETGAVNAVTGMILDYRAFDTVGDSHVLFAAACAVLMLLLGSREDTAAEPVHSLAETDPIVRQTAKLMSPVIVLLGIYLVLTGHLGPGGGFSGGTIIGAGLILYTTVFGFSPLERYLNYKSFRVILILSLGFYSLAKCYAFYCGANGIETVFSVGTPGAIFSAGLILPLNIAVGLVVACTMYGFYSVFQRGRI